MPEPDMKVVLFCGGFGLRIREHSETVPKPMIPIGDRPVLWHVMRYYAHFGHRDFILCLGYQAQAIKNYFLNYDETVSNDFVMDGSDRNVTLLGSDVHDWRITFVDTGMHASIGERLMAVRSQVEGEATFLANYADIVTDAHLPRLVDAFHQREAVAQMMVVRPNYTFHVIDPGMDGVVTDIHDVRTSGMWINGGYMVFTPEVFNYMRPGEDLTVGPYQRMIKDGKLSAYRHEGFWAPMDTMKEKQALEEMYQAGQRPPCVRVDPPVRLRWSRLELPAPAGRPLRILALGRPLRRSGDRLRRARDAGDRRAPGGGDLLGRRRCVRRAG